MADTNKPNQELLNQAIALARKLSAAGAKTNEKVDRVGPPTEAPRSVSGTTNTTPGSDKKDSKGQSK